MELTFNSWIYLLTTLGIGGFTPIKTYTSIHVGTDSFDSKQPMVSLGIQHDINKFRFFFEHQSSPVTDEDYGLNHAGIKYLFDSGLYAGASKKISKIGYTSVIGYEKGILMMEYSSDRIYSGVKFTL